MLDSNLKKFNLTCQDPNVCAKFNQNRVKTVTIGEVSQTDGRTDKAYFNEHILNLKIGPVERHSTQVICYAIAMGEIKYNWTKPV